MPELIAAIDQGTTSTRCVLFDGSGQIVQLSQQEHEQIYPKPGWVEHDPLEIWGCTQDVISQALLNAQVVGDQIFAVGVTNQRETTIVWDKKTGQPYGNAIVWQDTRTKEICDALGAEEGPDRFRDLVGLPLSTYFSGPKLKWILENKEDVRGAAEKGEALFGTVDTWLIWWLTGGPEGGTHVIDVTNASRTMLMNLSSLNWNEDILETFNIPPDMLPRIVPSSDPPGWGMTEPSGPFGAAIPICGDLGDQQAALVGQACFTTGEVKNTYGTGCFMLMNTGERIVPSDSGLLTTVAYRLGEEPAVYALEGSIAITGALVQWLRDNLELISSAAEIETLAQSVEDSGGIYFVPAFSGLFAPHWRSDARGVIVGLTRYINKGHIARSALESTAYQTREVLDAMNTDSGVELSSMKVDGGMVHNDLLMQFQADIINVPVLRPRIAETTALGAAYAAGLAVGFWESTESLREQWQVDKTWQPGMEESTRSGLYRGWQKAVERSLNWVD